MPFITDNQTLADLNLLGKFKTGSMFNLFNEVQTKGGERLLEQLFKHPLDNAKAINERAAQIEYLRTSRIAITLDKQAAELATQLLSGKKTFRRIFSLFDTCSAKLKGMLYHSEKWSELVQQIKSIQHILTTASLLLNELEKKEQQINPYKTLQNRLQVILTSPAIKRLAGQNESILAIAGFRFAVNRYKNELNELLSIIFHFDVFIAVGNVAARRGLTYALAVDGDDHLMLYAENLRHPSLKDATGNNVDINKSVNLVFLTGANMAGKSTWMKTLGISFYLAHMGFPVAANNMRFCVMEGLFTSINVPDDMSLGWSHFYAEVMRVKSVAQQLSEGKRLFVLFDELFKGTNVKDAFDATLAVTDKLAKYDDCAFVISTHIIEVGNELRTLPNINFQYMPTIMEGAVPRYTYKLTEGISSDRQGMVIIENEKILEMFPTAGNKN